MCLLLVCSTGGECHQNSVLWQLLSPDTTVISGAGHEKRSPDPGHSAGVSFSVTASMEALRQKLLWSLNNNRQQVIIIISNYPHHTSVFQRPNLSVAG